MERSLIRIGDDYAVEIDQAMLDLLRITPQTPVDMTVQGDTIVLRPVRENTSTKAQQQPTTKLDDI